MCSGIGGRKDEEDDALLDEIVIDFVEPNPLDEKAEEAKKFYDEGLLNKVIAQRMKCSPAQVTKLLQHWFRSRELDMPDSRARRASLEQKSAEPPFYQRIADDAKRLFDEELLVGEIAIALTCDINTVRKALVFWHESRGLETPDGRTRRKALSRKVSKPRCKRKQCETETTS